MNARRAFLLGGFMVLVWSVFWNGAIRAISLRFGDSPASKGAIFNL